MSKRPETNTMAALANAATHEPKPFVAKPKRDRKEGSKFYPMTFRIPRQTADRLSQIAFERKTSLQALVAEAVDRWMRDERQGTFLPEGWEDE